MTNGGDSMWQDFTSYSFGETGRSDGTIQTPEPQRTMHSDEFLHEPQVSSVEEYYQRGEGFLLVGDYKKAEQCFQKAKGIYNPNEERNVQIPQNHDVCDEDNGLLRTFIEAISQLQNIKQVTPYRLVAGTYIVGTDIPSGRCDLYAECGSGYFCLYSKVSSSWVMGNPIGITDGATPSRFRNLTLMRGDRLVINGDVIVVLSSPIPLTRDITEVLTPGFYRFGVDIPTGRYNLKVCGGEGTVAVVDIKSCQNIVYQDMSVSNETKANEYHNLVCTRKNELWIIGNLQIRLVHG